jgi:hypothetical protein
MREIKVFVVNSNWGGCWEMRYPIDATPLKVGQVKDLLRMENEVFQTQNQIMLYGGEVIPSDEMLLSDIVSAGHAYVFSYTVTRVQLPI